MMLLPSSVIEPASLLGERSHRFDVVASDRATIARFALDGLDGIGALLEHVAPLEELLTAIAGDVEQLTRRAMLQRRPILSRVAWGLLELAEGGDKVQVTQATLAVLVGATRERVNKSIKALVGQRALRKDRGCYILTNVRLLRAIAQTDEAPTG